jgi:hypothetical protein
MLAEADDFIVDLYPGEPELAALREDPRMREFRGHRGLTAVPLRPERSWPQERSSPTCGDETNFAAPAYLKPHGRRFASQKAELSSTRPIAPTVCRDERNFLRQIPFLRPNHPAAIISRCEVARWRRKDLIPASSFLK